MAKKKTVTEMMPGTKVELQRKAFYTPSGNLFEVNALPKTMREVEKLLKVNE